MTTITLFTREFPPVLLGGVGNTARFLAKELAKSDYKVNVITPKFGKYSHLPFLEKKKNITIYRLQMKERLLFWYKTALFSYFNRKIMKNTDLIHLLNARDAPFIYKKSPVIANINDYVAAITPINPFNYPYREKNKFIKYFHYNFWKFLDSKSLKRADFIIPNSNYSWKVVSKVYGLKNKEHKVVHKGVDVGEFKGNSEKDIDLLFIGSPLGQKGAKEFIQAVSLLKKKNKEINCIMIGRPSRIDYNYRLMIKKLGLEKNIKIIDFLPHKELIKYYLKSKIYVSPTHREALGQTILEAIAAKLPVIATNVGGVPEIITKNIGFLVPRMEVEPLAEKMDYLLENPEVRKEMGINGYERVRRYFNFERMLKGYLDVYNRFI